MKVIITIGLSVVLSLGLNAQEYDRNAINFSETITAAELEKHLNIIASDKLKVEKQGKKARRWQWNI